MEKKKYGIYHISDIKNSIVWFEAESFDIMAGSAVLVFKDRHGSAICAHHLEQGHYVTTL